jgi:hypothetical protein
MREGSVIQPICMKLCAGASWQETNDCNLPVWFKDLHRKFIELNSIENFPTMVI